LTDPTPERLSYLLVRVCGLKHRRMHELLDELGLYQGQPSMLRALWEQDGLTQSELAARLERSPSTITKTVKRMEKAGFVARRADPRDERISHVVLTAAGRSVQAAVEGVWQRFEEEAFAGLEEGELDLLRELLLCICHNIEEASEVRAEAR
jgi:DNA-binding MarR family transcriptional regulator